MSRISASSSEIREFLDDFALSLQRRSPSPFSPRPPTPISPPSYSYRSPEHELPSYDDVVNGELSDATADVVIEATDFDSDLDVPRRSCSPPPAYSPPRAPRRPATPEVMADVEPYSPRAYSPTMPPFRYRTGYQPETSPISSPEPSRAVSPMTLPPDSSSSSDEDVARNVREAVNALTADSPDDADLFDPTKAAGFRNDHGDWKLHLGYRRVLRRRRLWFGCALCLRLFKTRSGVKRHFNAAHVVLDAARDVDCPECPECDRCVRCAPPRC